MERTEISIPKSMKMARRILTVAVMSTASILAICGLAVEDKGGGKLFESAVNRRCRPALFSFEAAARDCECECMKLPLKRFGVE